MGPDREDRGREIAGGGKNVVIERIAGERSSSLEDILFGQYKRC